MVEQLTCNQQVVGSSPITSSNYGGIPERPKGADCKSVVFRLRWFESSFLHQNGRIAQLGEHLPYKQEVTGSIPVVPTIFFAGIAQLVEQLTCNQQVVGSSPITSSIFKVNPSIDEGLFFVF